MKTNLKLTELSKNEMSRIFGGAPSACNCGCGCGCPQNPGVFQAANNYTTISPSITSTIAVIRRNQNF